RRASPLQQGAGRSKVERNPWRCGAERHKKRGPPKRALEWHKKKVLIVVVDASRHQRVLRPVKEQQATYPNGTAVPHLNLVFPTPQHDHRNRGRAGEAGEGRG